MRMKPIERHYTLREAGALLSVHPKTFFRWADEGRVKLVKVVGQNRIAESQLRRLLNG